jgi:hypothetical protein
MLQPQGGVCAALRPFFLQKKIGHPKTKKGALFHAPLKAYCKR